MKTPLLTLVWILMAPAWPAACFGQDLSARLLEQDLKLLEVEVAPVGNGYESRVLKCVTNDESKPFVYLVVIAIGDGEWELNNGDDVDRYLKGRNDAAEITSDIQEFGLDEAQASKLTLAAQIEVRRIKRLLMAVPSAIARPSDVPRPSRSFILPVLTIADRSPLRHNGSFYHKVLQSLVGHDVPAIPDSAEEARKSLRMLAFRR